jgi:catechol 2,3-dioxygenase-like lactoylglutathione lyase family enzyme
MMRLLVNVDVDDLERAIEFYRAAFGLHLGRRLFDGSVAEMRGASSMIGAAGHTERSVWSWLLPPPIQQSRIRRSCMIWRPTCRRRLWSWEHSLLAWP